VDASGFNYGGSASQVVYVRFYADAEGRPGTQEYLQATAQSTLGGNLVIPLATPAVLAAGIHWLSVQPIGATASEEWFWYDRTPVSGAPAYFQTGVGASCRTWTLRSTCQSGAAAPDQAFVLKGTAGSPPAGTPTPTPTITPTASSGPSPTATSTSVYNVPTTTPTPTVTPTATPPAASSAFTLKRVSRHKRKAIAYAVTVQAAGHLTARATARRGKTTIEVGHASLDPSAAPTVRIKVRLSKAARKALAQHKLKVRVRVTFTAAGSSPSSQTKRVKLRRR
jgi:hypothetical protein